MKVNLERKSKTQYLMDESDFEATEQVMGDFYDWVGIRGRLIEELIKMVVKLEKTLNKV